MDKDIKNKTEGLIAEDRQERTKGPYIVWMDYGYEGWKPDSYATLKEAVDAPKYGNAWVMTKRVEYTVTEVQMPFGFAPAPPLSPPPVQGYGTR